MGTNNTATRMGRWRLRKPSRREALLLGLMLAVAGAGIWWGHEDAAANVQEERVVAVEMGDVEDTVTAQGKLEPKEYVDVGTQVSGQLQKLHVELGDDVSAGELLAEIDPTVYASRVEGDMARLRDLQAQLAQQQAQTELARQQHERNVQLIASHAVSQQDVDTTASALKVAQARIASLQAQIAQQRSTLSGDQANLSYTKIYAPISGTVVAQTTREGQTVNASQQAPTIVQVANLDVMTARAEVAEADVMRLKPEMGVYFTTLGDQERKWQGQVRQILPTPETVNDVVLYNVLVDADNTSRQLMTGMSTQMFFVVGEARNVMVVPVQALGRRLAKQDSAAGKAYRIKVKEGGSTVERVVHVGLTNRTLAEVKDGVKVGDEIVVPQVVVQSAGGGGGGRMGRMMGPRL